MTEQPGERPQPEILDESSPVFRRAEPRYFGLTPHLLVAALSAIALGGGLIVLATGGIAVGILLLAAGIFLGALFVEQARRSRDSSLDRVAAATIDRSLALAGFAGVSVRTWTRASRSAAGYKLEARKLARERSHLQYELGGAVHIGDASLVEELRGRMCELDLRIAECARQARAEIEQAQRRTSRERRAVASTQIRPPG
jgi:hypothetical protein